jgi:ABC-type glycerol-3-phosphate transport system substrate-binding protein
MKFRLFLYIVLAATLVASAACGGASPPAPSAPQDVPAVKVDEQPAISPNWAFEPMKETTTVVLSVEAGAMEKTLSSFKDEIKQKLNIDLQVVPSPFADQFQTQYLDLSSGGGQFDLLSFWPIYVGDYAPFLAPLEEISPSGSQQVSKDLFLNDLHPAYMWTIKYKEKIYGILYDGDVKLLNYRHDVLTDSKFQEAFKAAVGYDYDVDSLTWDQYLDIGKFVNTYDSSLYGSGEIANFFGGFTWKDRFVGMGGHFFDYDAMNALTGTNFDICIAAMQHGIDTITLASPPDARSYEFEDARNKIISEDKVIFVPQWPDVWKWANDPSLGSETAVGNVSIAIMPGFERDGKVIHRPEMNGGRILAVSKSSKAKEAAYKVIAFFADPQRGAQLLGNNDTWIDPTRISHMDPKLYTPFCTGSEWNCQIFVDVLDKSMAAGYPGLQIPGTGRYLEVYERWTKKAFAGQSSVQEACKGIQSEFDGITDQIGRQNQILEHQRYVDEALKPLGLWP